MDFGQSNTYETYDFLEVCYLIAKDVKIVSANRDSQMDKVRFEFNDRKTCEKMVKDLTLGNDDVSAGRFMEAIRKARKVIHTT